MALARMGETLRYCNLAQWRFARTVLGIFLQPGERMEPLARFHETAGRALGKLLAQRGVIGVPIAGTATHPDGL